MSRPILLTGGGSGGHITPLLAVAAELKRRQPDTTIIYIGQKGDNLSDIPASNPHIDEVYSIRAGKFRRYHGEGLRQLLDLSTVFKNARDALYVLVGLWQSRRLLKKLQPAVIFVKGGFVGVPVGLAAAQLHIPYITHDSDSVPGLANRLIARWAAVHAVAMPKEVYAYPQDKTVTTGIPLRKEFVPVTDVLQAEYRKAITIPKTAKLLFIIGGGLGSQAVNRAVGQAVPHLLGQFPDLHVVHGVGRSNEEEMSKYYNEQLSDQEQGRVRVHGYLPDVYQYSGAADLIITRAGATNLAEFAVQGKACIVVPAAFLTGGHQVKNAEYLAEQSAVSVLRQDELEADPNRLAKQVSELIANPAERAQMGKKLSSFAHPNATSEIADLIICQVDKQKRSHENQA